MTFFSHRPQISNFPPISPVSVHFPTVSRKLLFPTTLKNPPPVLEKFTCFLHTSCGIRFTPTLTMMHLCITQCTYWTPLSIKDVPREGEGVTTMGDIWALWGRWGSKLIRPSALYINNIKL